MMPYRDERQLLSNFRGFNLRLTPRTEPPSHLPSRPSWTCGTCGNDWPCAAARERLMREHGSDPTAVAVLMWQHLEHYALDQGAGPLSGAFARFIAWTR